MGPRKDDRRLRFVDTVLYDLAFGGGIDGGVGVMRRPGAGAPGMVVIQSGEEGRHELALPDVAIPDAIVRFVAELQTRHRGPGRTQAGLPQAPPHSSSRVWSDR